MLKKLAISMFIFFAVVGTVYAQETLKQALWVWPVSVSTEAVPVDPADEYNEIANPGLREQLISRSVDSGVDVLYVNVYHYPENTDGDRMYEKDHVADLISRAHADGIEVWAAYGNPDWPVKSCGFAWATWDGGDGSLVGGTSFPIERMAEIVEYNIDNPDNPSAKFDGVILDVEPPEPQTESEFQKLLKLYDCIHDFLECPRLNYYSDCDMNHSLPLAVAIRFYWDDIVEFPAGNGTPKPVYEHIIDMDLENVVVMGYRDAADVIETFDEDEIAYANSLDKDDLILVGLETQETGVPDNVTFFEEGQVAMNQAAHDVAEHFGGIGFSFGGFAVHYYRNLYLSGVLPGWPLSNVGVTDVGFPNVSFPNTLAGTNVASIPVDTTTWTTPVTLTFGEVEAAGTTSLTTSDSGPPPLTGFVLGDPPTYYDLGTSATFSGLIQVCIDYSEIGFDGSEEDLRLYHYGGAGWVDATVGIEDDIICASVSSLSPFAIFEPVEDVTATIDLDSDTLNLKSKGKWITCYIELPDGHEVDDIDVGTVELEDTILAEAIPNEVGDNDGDGIPDLMVKFDRQELIDYLDGATGEATTLTVTGKLDDGNGGTPFEGSDTIRVVSPGKGKKAPDSLAFEASDPYPNPANPEVWIPYTLGQDVETNIAIYSSSGRLIRTLALGYQSAGAYINKDKAAYWNGRNEAGEQVASGIYFYTIQAGEFTATRKMIVAK